MNVELMMKVRERILCEPQAVDMFYWGNHNRFRGLTHSLGISASCGTVGCVAGHTLAEVQGKFPVFSDDPITFPGNVAAAMLGLSEQEGNWLFYFHKMIDSPYKDLTVKLLQEKPGTSAYAAVVVEAIDRCIERNSGNGGDDQKPVKQQFSEADRIQASALGVNL